VSELRAGKCRSPIAELKGVTPLKSVIGNRHFPICCSLLSLLLAPSLQAQRPDSALVAVVRDYTGLYTRATFDQWTRLFGPAFTSASTNPDGTITVRNLAQFLDAQRQGFARAREMREELANVRIEHQGRMASIWADFVFHYDGTPSNGKLVLLAVSDTLGWKFHSLIFSYDR